MKIIGFEDIANLQIEPKLFYDWVEEMLKQKQTALLPPKISMKQAEHCFCNVMPCVLPDMDAMGVKIVSRYPSNKPALTAQILLYCKNTGELLSLMDGTYITSMRTGAVAAHSINTFSKTDFESLGFIGLGNTARATMLIFAEINKEKEYRISLLRYKDHAEKFIKRFEKYSNLKFAIINDAAHLIQNSDTVVSCVTYTDTQFAGDDCYKEGCTVIPVHTRGFQNCDLFFDKVFADDRGHVEGFKYFSKFKCFAETYDVLSGKHPGRVSDNERIIVYNIGISIHDVFFASKIYRELGNLPDTKVCLCKDIEKYWV